MHTIHFVSNRHRSLVTCYGSSQGLMTLGHKAMLTSCDTREEREKEPLDLADGRE